MNIVINDKVLNAEALNISRNSVSLTIDKIHKEYKIVEYTDTNIKITDGSKVLNIFFTQNKTGNGYQLFVDGKMYQVSVQSTHKATQGDLELKRLEYFSPMPGKISKVVAKLGQKVKKGDILLYLEAMKMEHPIKAATDGEVESIVDTVGKQVEQSALLVKLKNL